MTVPPISGDQTKLPARKLDPRLLIDGYNLLFQSGFTGKGRGPDWLVHARRRLLSFLEHKLSADENRSTQIVFDANRKSAANLSHVTETGLVVTFAWQYPEADDLLEEIIQHHSHPKSLRVVSSDQRIRRKARARRSESIDSDSFLTELERRPVDSDSSNRSLQERDSKPQKGILSTDEVDYWLGEFGKPDKP